MLEGMALAEVICDDAGKPVDHRFLDVNPAFERMMGLAAAGIVGRTARDLAPTLDQDWIERCGNVALTGESIQFETYIPNTDRTYLLRVFRPAPRQFAVLFHDVTERVLAEAGRRERSAFAESIIASAGEGVIVYDRELRYVVWNPVMEELTGLTAREVIGKGALETLPGVMATGVGDDLEQALAGAAPTSREFEYSIPTTGRRGWVVQTNRPHRNANGETVGVVSSVRDITAQHEIEEATRRSEEEFRTIFDSVGDGVSISEPGGKFIEVNRVVCERLGYTREELLSMPVAAINSPEAAALIPERVTQIMRGGTPVFETTHIRRDGTSMPIEAVARLIEFRGRQAILSVHRDITERKRSAEALSEQARFLQQLLDAIPVPIVAKDLDGRIRLHNAMFSKAAGPHEQIIGKTIPELGMPEPAVHLEHDQIVLSGGPTQIYELSIPWAGGKLRRQLLTKAALRAADGTPTGVVTASIDINDRYEAEQALRQSEERFRTLFESAGDAIFIIDLTGRFIEANHTAHERLGYSKEEFVGMSVADIDKTTAILETPELVEAALADGIPALETTHVRRDGTAFPVEVIGTFIDFGGKPAVLSIARDVSERKRAESERAALEAQLREAQKMEGIARLAGGVAHDFNNLLTVIRGNASLALAEIPEGGGVREELEEIEQAADRAAGLTRQLLAFARRTVLKPEVVDPSLILRGLEPMLRRLVGEDVALETVAPAGAGRVLVDPGQLEQVIVNLVVNARDAMPDGGTVTIEVADIEMAGATAPDRSDSAGPMTTISVSDTGTGMEASTLERLFEPFFTTKDPSKGTGLGLATVYGIVRMSGGKVTVRSELGIGSTLTVYLPRAEAASATDPEPSRATGAGADRAGTILVVEDDPGVRRFATKVLEAAGYTVLAVPGGAAAVEIPGEVPVQLLLTDVVMPGMSGRDVATRLSASRPGIAVLYMSGHTDKGIVHDGVLEPGIEFLGKPFTAEALLAAVDAAMTRAPAA
jgi:PAS domain S-box-containing protein